MSTGTRTSSSKAEELAIGWASIRAISTHKLNGAELSGQMIHTTPDNEAATARGQVFSLSQSHGCVHIRPDDRTRLIGAGVFKIGTPFIVHSYAESFPNPGTP